MLLHDGPLTSQPQEAVEVDWGNPLTAGLAYAQVGPSAVNIAAGSGWAVGDMSAALGRTGVGLSLPGSTSNYLRDDILSLGGSGTALALFRMPSAGLGANRAIFGIFQIAGGAVAHYLSYEASYDRYSAVSTGGYNWTIAAASGAPIVDEDCLLVGRFSSESGRDLWQNGALVATDAATRVVNATNVLVGVYASDGFIYSPFLGSMYCTLWWNRVLTDEEVRAVSANPWQLFRVRQVVLPASAAPSADVAGSVALGLTATGSIAVAKPVSGAVAVALATSGSIAVAKPVAGGVNLALSATGAIAVNKPVAGSVAMGVACSGALTVPKPVAGSVAVGLTAAGSVAVAKPVAGNVAVALTTSGALTTVGMGGAVAVSVATAGSVAVAKPVSGAVLVSLTTAAALTVAKPVGGNVALSLTTSGGLLIVALGYLDAMLTITARHEGVLGVVLRHAGELTVLDRHEAVLQAIARHEATLQITAGESGALTTISGEP